MTGRIERLAAALPMLRALAAGQAAGANGEPITACPYRVDADRSVERAQARMWLRGYARARPDTIDYSG